MKIVVDFLAFPDIVTLTNTSNGGTKMYTVYELQEAIEKEKKAFNAFMLSMQKNGEKHLATQKMKKVWFKWAERKEEIARELDE